MDKKFLTKKRIIWSIIILAVAGLIIFSYINKKNAPNTNIQTDTVKKQDIEQTVLTTGQVVSKIDLGLSFQGSGVVRQIRVKEGDKVRSGQVLATLDQASAGASLTSALGSLAQAEANYQKVLSGASNEQIIVAQKAVEAAETTLNNAKTNLESIKQQQAVLVKNTYNALLNTTPALAAGPSNRSSANPVISGTYTGAGQGQYKLTIFMAGNTSYIISGLGSGTGPIPFNASSLVSIGNGLFIQFPAGTYYPDDYWTIDIPNTKATNYLTNLSAHQSALETERTTLSTSEAQVRNAEIALEQAKASLAVQQASARPADIAVAKAQILSAQGQVAAARAALGNLTLRAPAAGTITEVAVKVGEQASALQAIMTLQNIGELHAEANVSEANVASLKIGQTVDFTFDALGPDRHSSGTIQTINPASTVVSGVVNYKITASIPDISDIKPGMTANMTVLVAEKKQVLTVQNSAIISENGQRSVRVIEDPIKKTYREVSVTTGLEADGGLVEILSGLTEGQEVVTYIKP